MDPTNKSPDPVVLQSHNEDIKGLDSENTNPGEIYVNLSGIPQRRRGYTERCTSTGYTQTRINR